jgi:hypothetical protein
MPVKPDTTPGRTGNCIAPVYLVPFPTARAGYDVTLTHVSVTPKGVRYHFPERNCNFAS